MERRLHVNGFNFIIATTVWDADDAEEPAKKANVDAKGAYEMAGGHLALLNSRHLARRLDA